MPRLNTPFVGCDVFILNQNNQVLLIKRADNSLWAMPGGAHGLGEKPKVCAERECLEKTGLETSVVELLGVFSSNCYEYINCPWRDNEFCHILFRGKIKSGTPKVSSESLSVAWFSENNLPHFE